MQCGKGKNAETMVSKGNTFPNKDIFKKPTNNKKKSPKNKTETDCEIFVFPIPQSLVPPIDCIDDSMFKKINSLKQI